MLILPSSDPERAQRLLSQVADDRRHAAIVVFGNTERAREIASRADVRAEGHPFRRVVLVPDLTVLAQSARFAWLVDAASDGVEAVAVTLDFRLSARLSGDVAVDFDGLEKAFADATAGRVAP